MTKITPDVSRNGEGVFWLKGISIVLQGRKVNTDLTYPDGRNHLEGVAAMGRIYPGYRLRPQYLHTSDRLSPGDVSAYFPLTVGEFRRPKLDPRMKWHFFPPRGEPIRGGLAQAVGLHVDFVADTGVVMLVPFGQHDASVVLAFANTSGEVPVQIGNVPPDDVFPRDPNALPPIGPDHHFEIYYRLTEPVDEECFPVPYFEGRHRAGVPSHGHQGHGLVTAQARVPFGQFAAGRCNGGCSISLGGANCPPNQWP